MSLELPSSFVKRMQAQLGPEYEAFAEALNQAPVISLRYNPDKPGADFPDSSPIPWCETGIYLDERPKFFKDPFIYAGSYYVQEASSMLIGQCLDFSQDMNILDLCAAPGGKSTLLASQMSADSLLVSNELVYNRSKALIDNLSRWGKSNVAVTNNHPRDFSQVQNFFDALVIDAPCSGEGMFRKDPKVAKLWTSGVVRNCALRQKDILMQVIGSLKPGGRLIYSTCTYNPSENEEIIQWILNREPGAFRIVPLEFPAEWGLTPGTTESYCPEMAHTYHCYPHKVRGEGFFFACLEKLKPTRQLVMSPSQIRKQRRKKSKGRDRDTERERPKVILGKKEMEIAAAYLDTDLELVERYEGFDAIAPRFQEDLEYLGQRLKVLKAGIRVGTVHKQKFIPDHDLALSGLTSKEVPIIEIERMDALRFMKRMSFSPETGDAKDWAVLSYKGRRLGWVKVLDKRVNNHLPKHLRLRAEINFNE